MAGLFQENLFYSIKVSCLKNAEATAREQAAHVVISILDLGTKVPEFRDTLSLRQRLRFFFNDQESVVASGMKEAVADLVRLGQTWRAEGKMPRLLVHCYGGVSRSTAAAYILMCAYASNIEPEAHFQNLLKLTNKPWPNLRMIEIADDMLKTGGAITSPVMAYREKYRGRIDAYGRLNLRRGIASSYKR